MGNARKVPEYVRERLLQGENVLSEISIRKLGFYATDKRLLLFMNKQEFNVFEYDKMSITFEGGTYWWTSGLFKVCLYIGLFAASLGTLLFIGFTLIYEGSYLRYLTLSGAEAAFGLGFSLLGGALALPTDCYKIECQSSDEKARASRILKMRLVVGHLHAKKIVRFVRVIQEMTTKYESPYWLVRRQRDQ